MAEFTGHALRTAQQLAVHDHAHADAFGHGDGGGKHFVFAVASQFLYVGAQVGTWSYMIPYTIAYTGVGERLAGYWLTGALVSFTVGRFFSAWLLRFVRDAHLLGAYAVVNAAVCIVAVLRPGWLGVGSLVAVSFFMSAMFPTIVAYGSSSGASSISFSPST